MEPVAEKTKFWKLYTLRACGIICTAVILWGLLKICSVISIGVATIALTAAIVFACHGPVAYFERKGLNRMLGTVVTFCIAILAFVLLLLLVLPAVIEQGIALANAMPGYLVDAENFITAYLASDNAIITSEQLVEWIDQARQWLVDNAGEMITGFTGGIVGFGTAVGNGGLVLFISVVASLWLLIDLPTILEEFRSLFNPKQQEILNVITGSFNDAFYGWAKATFTCAFVNGLGVGILFALVGIPYASLLGVVVGILYIIPCIGPVLMYVVCALVALTASPLACLLSIVINFIVNTLVLNVMSPKMMMSTVSVHPAITLIAIPIGGALGGMLGMLLSMPLVAAVQAIFVTFFEARTGKSLYAATGALFKKDAPSNDCDTGGKKKFSLPWKKDADQ